MANKFIVDINENERKEKEKEQPGNCGIIFLLAFILLGIFVYHYYVNIHSSDAEKYEALKVRLCEAVDKYLEDNPRLSKSDVGKTIYVKFKDLANANLIETNVLNPFYEGNFITDYINGEQKGKYYSIDANVKVTVTNDGKLECEVIEEPTDVK